MKKKYIIALEDRNVWSCGLPAKTLLLSDVSIFGTDLASVNTGIELTPYTEPDLEQVRKEAYDKCRGDVEMLAHKLYSPKIDGAYQIYLDSDKGGLAPREFTVIFDNMNMQDVFAKLSASDCIEKIRQYEQEKQFHIGEEIVTQNGFRGVVTGEDGKYVYFINGDGREGCVETMMAAKTGRHFPEFAEALQKMREG